MTVLPLLQRGKDALVEDRARYRRVLSGIGSGSFLALNLRHQFRMFIGRYEVEISRFLKSSTRPGSSCYDIGAADGYYTLALAKLASPGRIYAIEPDVKRCVCLRETVVRNPHINSRIMVLNTCLGRVVNQALNAVSMDHLVFERRCQPPDLMKIDVEGAEYDCLVGSRRVIREFSPVVILEVHSLTLEELCRGLLEDGGYHVEVVDRRTMLPEYRPIEHNRWLCARNRNASPTLERAPA